MTAPRPPYGQQPHPQQPYQPAPGSEHYQHHMPPQQPYAPPPPAAKRKRKWPWIVLGVLVVIAMGSALNGGKSTPAPTSGTSPAAAPAAAPAAVAGHTVTYQVTGTGKATSISYTKEGFQMEQTSNARLPFSKDLTFKDDVTAFSGLSLVAQNGASSGDITCKILVDGKEVASSTSSGQYALVTCNGTNA